jgi:LDH2 family malate/lactate/ureidoglycolate dehydrogenase
VSIPGGSGRFLSTNPWSIGVPSPEGGVIYDAATSAIAEGKIRVARAKQAQLPPGSIVDPDGNPSTDPEDYYRGGALLPMGGELAGHKGYGLSLASALIGGLAAIGDPDLNGSEELRGRITGVFMIVIDPTAFGTAGAYTELVGETVAAIRRSPRRPGAGEAIVPGEPERRAREVRGATGIEIPERTWTELQALATRFGVAVS